MSEDLAAIDMLLRLIAAGALVAVALLLVVLLVVMMTAYRVYGWPQHPPLDHPGTEAARRRVLLAARGVRTEYGPYAEPGPNDGLGQAVLGLIEALDDLDQVIEP